MASIEEARQQVATARQILAEKRAQSEELKRQLDESDRSLPDTTTAESLRSKFGSMQGRIQRRAIEDERNRIRETQGYVKDYEKELGEYEQNISQTETEINYAEKKYQELKADAREEAKAQLESYKKKFEEENPGEQLIIDWSKLRVQGVSSGALSQSLSVEDYNKRIEQINQQVSEISSGKSMDKINPQIPMGYKIVPKKWSIKDNFFPSVSAKQYSVEEVPLNPATGRPYGVVKKAEVIKKYKDFLKEEGYVQGTLGYLGNKISGAIDRSQMKSGNYYQQEGIRNIGQILPTAVAYATPYAGEVVLIAGGTEKVIRNIPLIKTKPQEALTNIGWGAVEVGTGGLGSAGRVANLRLAREASALEKAPTNIRGLRFEGPDRGVDVVFGMKQTNPKGFIDRVLRVRPQIAVSRVEQPFVLTKRGAVLEGGRAYSVVLKKSKNQPGYDFTSAGYQQSGKVTQTPKGVFVRESGKTRIKSQPLEADTGMGYVNMRKVVENTGTIDKNRNLFFSDDVTINQVKTSKTPNADPTKVIFGGLAKKSPTNKNVYNILSGKIEKFRLYGDGFYKPKAIVKPNIKGKIRSFKIEPRVTTKRDGWDMFIGGSGKKSSPEYLQSLYKSEATDVGASVSASEAINNAIPKSESSFNNIVGFGPQTITQSPKASQSIWYGTGQYEKTDSVSVSKPNEASNSLFNESFNLGERQGDKLRERVKVKLNTKSNLKQNEGLFTGFNEAFNLRQPQKERLRLAQQQRSKQKLREGLKQNQFFDLAFRDGSFARSTMNFVPTVSYRTSLGKIIHSAPNTYLVVVKRFGTDSVIAEASTLAEAKMILARQLKSSLAASGFISTAQGTKQQVSDLFGSMFTRAKKDPFRLVQRRGKRLSSRSEVGEIMGFKVRSGNSRKSRTRRIKWWQ